jgi:arylsulfatase A-like enzyme
MKRLILFMILSGSNVLFAVAQKQVKPNIILIMVDDMGYSDIGAYGSEIRTPNLDRLAAEGIRFREFYNNSICAPTRASLITGQYPHRAGIGYFDVNLGLPAYQGFLNKESLTFGEVLKQNGYSTLMSGKWHVGNDSLCWPNQRGFEQFYGIIGGAANYFDASPLPFGNSPYPVKLIKNNKRLNPQPDSYYFTDEIGKNATEFLDEQNKTGKPFFLYVAFTAPHWPLQALPEDIARYKGRYDIGWDSLRVQRLARQKELGIFDPAQRIATHDPEVPYWNKLTWDEQQLWKAKMEVYAAMIDRMDQNVGRILAKLKELKKDDNTLVVFISDNGAQGGYRSFNQLNRGLVKNAGPIGTSGSFDYQEQSWAYVSNTPLRQYKNNMHEGGFSSPFIAWFPKQIKGGALIKGTAHLIDLAPTFYELAGAKYPASYQGATAHALPGKSLVPLLRGNATAVNRGEPLFWERAGNRAVRKGDWKIVSTYPSYKWELYDLRTDRGETKDLAAERPEIVNELSVEYAKWAERTGVVDYDKIKPSQPTQIPGQSTQPAPASNARNN